MRIFSPIPGVVSWPVPIPTAGDLCILVSAITVMLSLLHIKECMALMVKKQADVPNSYHQMASSTSYTLNSSCLQKKVVHLIQSLCSEASESLHSRKQKHLGTLILVSTTWKSFCIPKLTSFLRTHLFPQRGLGKPQKHFAPRLVTSPHTHLLNASSPILQ